MAGSTLCCQQTIHAFGFVSITRDKNLIGQRQGKATQHRGSQKYVSGFYNPLNPGSSCAPGLSSEFRCLPLYPSATKVKSHSSLCLGVIEEEELGAHAKWPQNGPISGAARLDPGAPFPSAGSPSGVGFAAPFLMHRKAVGYQMGFAIS